jgi:glucose 1-dehydrogenase
MHNPLSLEGQIALVTGANSGIGLETAIILAKAGASVIVNHLPGEETAAKSVCGNIAASGGIAVPVAADVSNEEQVESLFHQAIKHFGTLHILINNAGIQRDSPFAEMSLKQWQSVLDVNLTGQFLCARAAVREFKRRGMQPVSKALGKIICMSSVHQRIPWAFHANYAASKGGVTLLMQSMAQELAQSKIRINSIAPGAIKTPINKDVWGSEKSLSELMKLIPYGRIGKPEDIANTALWLASDMSDYVNGTTIFVDGGMSLYPGFRGNG